MLPVCRADDEYNIPFTSVLQDFEEFLQQSCSFPQLALTTTSTPASKHTPTSVAGKPRFHLLACYLRADMLITPELAGEKSVILLEDVPRPRDKAGLDRVRSALLKCLRSTSSAACSPIIMVCSEAGNDQDGTVTLSSLERWLSTEFVHHKNITAIGCVGCSC